MCVCVCVRQHNYKLSQCLQSSLWESISYFPGPGKTVLAEGFAEALQHAIEARCLKKPN